MTVGKLHPRVPLGRDESATSFLSRLARCNGVDSARRLCLDVGLDFQGVVDGRGDALSALAWMADAAQENVVAGAIVREGDAIFRLRDERLLKPALRRDKLHVCPACLSDDIAASGRAPEVAAYGRVHWLLGAIRTCPVHEMALVDAVAGATPSKLHDFALLMAPAVADLDGLAEHAARRAPSSLETYLLDRLAGVVGRSPWLDGLEFYAAAKTCEMVGAVAVHGRTPNLKLLTDDEWREAGAIGFGIAAGGETSIREFLADLQATFSYGRGGNDGPQATFGRLFQWIAFGAEDTSFDPVRDVVRRHVCETTPVGPGDVVLGQPVERRRIHSIRSASLEIGAHPKRLRKLLAAKALIADDHQSRPDNLVLFDAEAARDAMEAAVGLSLKEVESYLNAGRVQARLLAEHGFIRPLVAAGAPGIGENAFSRAELDAFLDRLLDGAEPMVEAVEPMADIPWAAKRACCSAAEVVRLILDRRLTRVGRLEGAGGYMSVLVDVEEIRRHVCGPALEGLTGRDLMRELRTNNRVVSALIAAGKLRATRAVNPVNRCPVDVVTCEELDRFRREYVSLTEMSEALGRHRRGVIAMMEERGVRPALDREAFGATFYRRAEVE
ncbi:TniQ protein [Rhodoblastus acidophilus]|uniref:TniQ protein n=1 Tax=Rhodoblastus acidophilus TaxID=1074 RepID=A0A212RH76_RHOAC|nr:TniQ family protein [Rhodoblastus acidophilus]PPQ39555.1 hypothetical protein CKO16_04750 [Rhodoblastus acidophilus]RAI24338.1 hypothetical protein CH337_00130 [Rhodoblastus acidophilus]SNB71747.1 TniQ protein [Rhodoblastus acidophilus]